MELAGKVVTGVAGAGVGVVLTGATTAGAVYGARYGEELYFKHKMKNMFGPVLGSSKAKSKKAKEKLNLKKKELEQKEKLAKQSIKIEQKKLSLQERALALREKELEMREKSISSSSDKISSASMLNQSKMSRSAAPPLPPRDRSNVMPADKTDSNKSKCWSIFKR